MKTIELKSGIGYTTNKVDPIIIDYITAKELEEFEKSLINSNIEFITIKSKKIEFKTIN